MCGYQVEDSNLSEAHQVLLRLQLEVGLHSRNSLLQRADLWTSHACVYLPASALALMFWTETGLNPYDVRRKCDRSPDKDGELCYKQMGWIETWMNDPKNKQALGVDPQRTFASCNMEVNRAFSMNGDGMHNSATLLPELVNAGVRLLVYAGNAGEFPFDTFFSTCLALSFYHYMPNGRILV